MVAHLLKLFGLFLPILLARVNAEEASHHLRKLAKPKCGSAQCTKACTGCTSGDDCTNTCGAPPPPPPPPPAPPPTPSGVCPKCENGEPCLSDADCPTSPGNCDAFKTTECALTDCTCNSDEDCLPNNGNPGNRGVCEDGVPTQCDTSLTCEPTSSPTSIPTSDPTSSPTPSPTPENPTNTLKVVILSGQSNMQGHGCDAHMNFLVNDGENMNEFGHLGTGTNPTNWATCPNVDILLFNDLDESTGTWPTESLPLKSMGFGATSAKMGPEVGIGWTLNNQFGGDNFLLVKIAWGGIDMAVNIRPDSAPITPTDALAGEQKYGFSGDASIAFDTAKYTGPAYSDFGRYYRLLIGMIQHSLNNLSTMVTDYDTKYTGYELAGFVWHQGFNDLLQVETVSDYEHVLAKFIYSLRDELEAPMLPFVIGELGMHGNSHLGKTYQDRVRGMRTSQTRVAECFTNATNLFNHDDCTSGGELDGTSPELINEYYPFYSDIPDDHKGNVKLAETAKFVTQLGDDPCPSVSECGCAEYHYHNNAATMYRMGVSMGSALVDLINDV